MTYILASYCASLAAFLALDMVWLGIMAPRFYKPALGDIALASAALAPAAIFYVVYPVGLTIFAVLPAVRSGSLSAAALNGALFGFFTYATYDLTNQATLRNWSYSLSAMDIAWGTVLGTLSSIIAFEVAIRFAVAR